MSSDARYYDLLAEIVPERRSKRRAREGEAVRQIRREKIAAGVGLPPTDLLRFARHLGVAAVRELPLAMRGRLVLRDGSIEVEINTALPEFEKKHTLAHELAHIILEGRRLALCQQVGENLRGGLTGSRLQLEELCDLGASEILLPAQWLRDRVRPHAASLEVAARVSEETNCELRFVLMRLIRLGWWDCRLLWWEERGGRICVKESFPPVDDLFLVSVKPSDEEGSVLGECLARGGVVEGRLKLGIGKRDHIYRAQCVKIADEGILSMLIFRS